MGDDVIIGALVQSLGGTAVKGDPHFKSVSACDGVLLAMTILKSVINER